MPRPDAPPLTRAVVLRGIGFGAAIALGAVAVWLIVTSTTQKRIEIGVLTGLWGLLLGAYSMFGARRHLTDGLAMSGPAGEIALRESTALERAEDADGRRDWETRLEQLLRREINVTMNREVAALRSEIAQLRQDLLEKVGGQLRLERIETTRLIGSDLEALQHEVRQLKVASETGPAVNELLARAGQPRLTPLRQVVEPARVRPLSRPTAEIEADIKPVRTRSDRNTGPRNESLVQTGEQSAIRPDAPAPRPDAVTSRADAAAAPQGADKARTKAQRAETQRTANEQREAARVEAHRKQAERTEAERKEAERRAKEQREAARVEAHRKQAERTEAERKEAEQKEAERKEAEREAVEREDAARKEVLRIEEERIEAARIEGRAETQRVEVPSTPPARSDDPFASLPRIRPFTDFALDPVESAGANGGSPPTVNGERNGAHSASASLDPDDYTGRRRRRGNEKDGADGADDAGRHSRHAEQDRAASSGHDRPPEEQDKDEDLLARLLAREGAEQ